MPARLSQQELLDRQKKYDEGLHWCSNCKEYKPAEQFNNHRNGKFGKHHYCKVCHRARRDQGKQKQSMNQRNRTLSAYYVKEAGGCCQKCGYKEFIPALDFHHINRHEKEYRPKAIIISNNHELTRRELDKCVLLCANCHRGYESGFWKAEFVKRDGLGWTIKRGSITKTEYDEFEGLPDKYRYSQMSLV